MATKSFDGKTLILVFENGVDELGNPKYITKMIPSINEAITEEQMYELGNSIAPLFNYPLSKIMIDEDYVLSV